MDTSTSAAPDEKTPPTQLSNEKSKLSGPLEIGAERFSSVARLTSSSISELQGLVSELQKMQDFLKSEVDNVQRQIDSALAGINIIVETIGPWKASQAHKHFHPALAMAARRDRRPMLSNAFAAGSNGLLRAPTPVPRRCASARTRDRKRTASRHRVFTTRRAGVTRASVEPQRKPHSAPERHPALAHRRHRAAICRATGRRE